MGDGSPCACCDAQIERTRPHFQVQSNAGESFAMHRECFYDWLAVLTEMKNTEPPGVSTRLALRRWRV